VREASVVNEQETPSTSASTDEYQGKAILSRLHQQAAGAITAICLLTIAIYWLLELPRRRRTIDIDRPMVQQPIPTDIDLNEASWPELTMLPGISETLARRIVAYRQQHGRFQSLDDLQMVPGIGPRSLSRVRPCLRPLTSPPAHVEQNAQATSRAAP